MCALRTVRFRSHYLAMNCSIPNEYNYNSPRLLNVSKCAETIFSPLLRVCNGNMLQNANNGSIPASCMPVCIDKRLQFMPQICIESCQSKSNCTQSRRALIFRVLMFPTMTWKYGPCGIFSTRHNNNNDRRKQSYLKTCQSCYNSSFRTPAYISRCFLIRKVTPARLPHFTIRASSFDNERVMVKYLITHPSTSQ